LNDTRQQQRDPRTGIPTALRDEACSQEIREACTALNSRRARGLMEISRFSPQRESVEIDVWTAALVEKAELWDVPIVPMEALGLSHDEDGFSESAEMVPLKTGAEACPYLDHKQRIVYKLFDLRSNGAMGKKIVMQRDAEAGLCDEIKDAVFQDTIRKLSAINDAGGHPTEIVGLVDSFDHLLVKQPLAEPYLDFDADRREAMDMMRCVTPMGGQFRNPLSVFYIQEEPWLLGDLHKGNIMRDAEGRPTVIDALVGYLPPYVLRELPWVGMAANDAKDFRLTGQAPLRKSLLEEVEDDEL